METTSALTTVSAEPTKTVQGLQGGWARHGIAIIVAFITFIAYLVLSVRNYQHLDVPSWDLGIFDQVVRNLAHGHVPVSLIKGVGYNIFGDHFHPIITLMVPAYWLHGSALTLLIVQDLLVALSALVVTRSAVRVAGQYTGFAIGIAYALSWGLQAAVAAQFHEIAFGLPLIALSLDALIRERWWACALWAAPLVLVKEDLGLTVAMIGLLIALRGRTLAWRLGLGVMAWGSAWFVLTVKVFLPFFNGQSRWDYGGLVDWHRFQGDPSLLFFDFVHPTAKLWTLLWLFGITGFLALRSPIVLAVIPTISWRFLSTNDSYWGTNWHYNAILMPIVFIAMIDTVRITRSPARPHQRRWPRWYVGVVAPATALLALGLAWTLPLREIIKPTFYDPTPRLAAANRVLSQIPDGVSIETDLGLLPYLTDRTDVYWMGREGNPAPEYLVIDGDGGGWNEPPSDVASYAESLHPGTVYKTVTVDGKYVLVKRQE